MWAIYYKGKKIKEHTSREYLMAWLYEQGLVYVDSHNDTWIDGDYKIKEEV